jgi:hypothetical protein
VVLPAQARVEGLRKEEGDEGCARFPGREDNRGPFARAYYGPVSGRVSLNPADNVRDQRGLRRSEQHAASERQQGLDTLVPFLLLVACCLLHIVHQQKSRSLQGSQRTGRYHPSSLDIQSRTLVSLYRAYPPGPTLASIQELRGEFEVLVAAGSHRPGSLNARAGLYYSPSTPSYQVCL